MFSIEKILEEGDSFLSVVAQRSTADETRGHDTSNPLMLKISTVPLVRFLLESEE